MNHAIPLPLRLEGPEDILGRYERIVGVLPVSHKKREVDSQGGIDLSTGYTLAGSLTGYEFAGNPLRFARLHEKPDRDARPGREQQEENHPFGPRAHPVLP